MLSKQTQYDQHDDVSLIQAVAFILWPITYTTHFGTSSIQHFILLVQYTLFGLELMLITNKIPKRNVNAEMEEKLLSGRLDHVSAKVLQRSKQCVGMPIKCIGDGSRIGRR